MKHIDIRALDTIERPDLVLAIFEAALFMRIQIETKALGHSEAQLPGRLQSEQAHIAVIGNWPRLV
jgi:hypothetical protein